MLPNALLSVFQIHFRAPGGAVWWGSPGWASRWRRLRGGTGCTTTRTRASSVLLVTEPSGSLLIGCSAQDPTRAAR